MAGPKGVKILKTTPKVIPWGIQNASLGSTPHSYVNKQKAKENQKENQNLFLASF